MGDKFHYFPLSTLPRLHQIVWCRVGDDGSFPSDTVRPGLVRETKYDKTAGKSAVSLSFGSVILDLTGRGRIDLVIQNAGRLDDLNLPHAVRFDLAVTAWLPWAEEFFAPPEHYFYIVAGTLSDDEKGRLRRRLIDRGLLRPM